MANDWIMIVSLASAVLAVSVCRGEVNDWENPEVNSINRLPARTYTMPLAAESDALTDALEPETPYAISLNGDWKYRWAGTMENTVTPHGTMPILRMEPLKAVN